MIDCSCLPLEVTSRIAEELEYDDVRSFALTCRSWQDAAEQLIWRELDLATNYTMEMEDIPNDEDVVEMEGEINDMLLRQRTRVLKAMQRRPGRAKMVRYIDFGIIPDPSCLLREIIELTHNALLEITFKRIGFLAIQLLDNDTVHRELYKVLDRCPVLNRVHTAEFSLASDWQEQLRSVARLCPSVARLDLHVSEVIFAAKDVENMTWLHLPALRRLSISTELERHIVFLTPLLKHNGELGHLSFEFEDEGFRLGDADAEAITALREYNSITRLDWCAKKTAYSNTRGLFDGTGFDNLKWVTFDASIYSESETYLENITIPAVKNLEKIAITCRRSNWHRSTKAPGWANVPPPRGYVIPTTVSQLRDCPSLTTVYFCTYGTDPNPDPLKWCSKRTNGILIRTYSNGTDEFIHLRRLELLKVNSDLYKAYCEDELDECHGKDHRWVDNTSYKGYRVLEDVLEQVYKLAKEYNKEWTEPGRGMSLPDKAWRALERGYKRAKKMPQW